MNKNIVIIISLILIILIILILINNNFKENFICINPTTYDNKICKNNFIEVSQNYCNKNNCNGYFSNTFNDLLGTQQVKYYKCLDNWDGEFEHNNNTIKKIIQNKNNNNSIVKTFKCNNYCPPGQGVIDDTNTCLDCPDNKYNTGDSYQCKNIPNCPTNYSLINYDKKTGNITCRIDARPGYYYDTDNLTEKPCNYGTYTDTYSNTTCSPAEIDYYVPSITLATGVSGWRLVRYLKDGSTTWHQATDSLQGTDVYGIANDFTNSWSIPFGEYDELCIGTLDLNYWVYFDKDQLKGNNNNTNKKIINSSYSTSPYKVEWRDRNNVTNPEDPWISIKGHSNEIVYGENNSSIYTSLLSGYGGLAVWVRSKKDNIIDNIEILSENKYDINKHLVAHYKFDGNYNDTISTNHLTLNEGTPVYDENNEYIIANNDTTFIIENPSNIIAEGQTEFTISCWINNWTTTGYLLRYRALNIVIYYDGDSTIEYTVEGKSGVYTNFYPITNWTLLTFVFIKNTYKLYINNIEVHIETVVNSDLATGFKHETSSDNIFNIFTDGNSIATPSFKGKLKDLKFYNKALLSSEVEELYNEYFSIKETSINNSTDKLILFKYNQTIQQTDLISKKTGVSGWRLVRYLVDGSTYWHQASDNLVGTDKYGTPFDNTNNWSIPFGEYDELCIGTFDLTYWVYFNKDQINTNYSDTERTVYKSSLYNHKHNIKWYNRSGNAEDPWISLKNHNESYGPSNYNLMVYGEKREHTHHHEHLLTGYGGMAVWVRKTNDIPLYTEYTIDFPKETLCDILLIGGGGAGGYNSGGGGGAGGLIYGSDITLKGTYNIKVGRGGIANNQAVNNFNCKGINTSISNDNYDIIAYGGGAGLNGAEETDLSNNGGSGGGSATSSSSTDNVGGLKKQINTIQFEDTILNGYGNDGGIGRKEEYGGWGRSSGGGGGAGGKGNTSGNYTEDTGQSKRISHGGDGGIGKSFDITGKNIYYAGGGGGSIHNNGSSGNPGIGGLGGGGNGANQGNSFPESGEDGKGGGGGGGKGGADKGGNGGSGILILRYKSNKIKHINNNNNIKKLPLKNTLYKFIEFKYDNNYINFIYNVIENTLPNSWNDMQNIAIQNGGRLPTKTEMDNYVLGVNNGNISDENKIHLKYASDSALHSVWFAISLEGLSGYTSTIKPFYRIEDNNGILTGGVHNSNANPGNVNDGQHQIYKWIWYIKEQTEYNIYFSEETECDILIVGGGGAGGRSLGGGGGAGGVIEKRNIKLKGNYKIKVGNGGNAYYGVTAGQNGTSSEIINNSASLSLIALGGGGANGQSSAWNLGGRGSGKGGLDGGSGGGGTRHWPDPGIGKIGQGNNGGTVLGDANLGVWGGAGGGGAGSVGGSNTATSAGNGGNGIYINWVFDLFGDNGKFAGGGGGGASSTDNGGIGGTGGGGNGGSYSTISISGKNNTGSGGGGGNNGGANGGTGVVIIRYKSNLTRSIGKNYYNENTKQFQCSNGKTTNSNTGSIECV